MILLFILGKSSRKFRKPSRMVERRLKLAFMTMMLLLVVGHTKASRDGLIFGSLAQLVDAPGC